jgi:hypothetical protein
MSAPFVLMFGRIANDAGDFSDWLPNPDQDPEFKQHLSHMREMFDSIFPAIADAVASRRERQLNKLNRQRRVIEPLPIGTSVMIRDPQRSKKRRAHYVGPYTVVDRTDTGSYRLRDDTGDMLDRSVPIEQLKVIPTVDQSNVQRVKAILDHDSGPDGYRYLVHWFGESADQATWVPQQDFNDFDVISNYWETLPRSISSRADDKAEDEDGSAPVFAIASPSVGAPISSRPRRVRRSPDYYRP